MALHEVIQEQRWLCRCEEVSVETARQAIRDGATSLNDVKRWTRVGMGICQGAFCAHELAELISQETGTPIDRLEPMTARPPARLITLGPLADMNRSDRSKP